MYMLKRVTKPERMRKEMRVPTTPKKVMMPKF